MSQPEDKLEELNIQLPPPPSPGGNYLPFKRTGTIVYCAGVISLSANGTSWTGQVGDERTLEDGYQAARLCALNALAVMKSITGSLNDIHSLLVVSGYVNAVAGYGESPAAINGASDLFGEVFGEAGKHARAAVSVAGLPKNATVEIQTTLELKPGT